MPNPGNKTKHTVTGPIKQNSPHSTHSGQSWWGENRDRRRANTAHHTCHKYQNPATAATPIRDNHLATHSHNCHTWSQEGITLRRNNITGLKNAWESTHHVRQKQADKAVKPLQQKGSVTGYVRHLPCTKLVPNVSNIYRPQYKRSLPRQ